MVHLVSTPVCFEYCSTYCLTIIDLENFLIEEERQFVETHEEF